MQKVRERRNKCMFIVLLGYFKSRPIAIIPKYNQIKATQWFGSDDSFRLEAIEDGDHVLVEDKVDQLGV